MKQHNWYSTFLLFFVCLLFFSYQNHFDNPFFFDDEHTIVNNNAIREVNVKKFFTDGTTFSTLPSNQSYRPGLTTLNALDIYWGGEKFPIAKQFHKTIFITYVFMTILVYFFFLEIFIIIQPHRWNSMFALFSTFFFALHTSNAETINYIIARSDLISTMMVVLSFILYMYKTRWRKYYIYLLPMIVGFTFKEPALLFIPLLFLYKFIIERKEGFTFELKKYYFIFPSILVAVGLFLFYLKMTPDTWTPGGTGRGEYFVTQFYIQLLYIKNFFLPTHLSADTDLTLLPFSDYRVIIGLLSIIVLIWIAYKCYFNRQLRTVTFGILWFYVALLPTSSIIPFAEVMNDHRTFFPYIGLVLVVMGYVAYVMIKNEEKLVQQKNKMIAICTAGVILISAHAYGVIKRNEVWDSHEKLWYDVTVKSPNNARGLMNYGLSQMAKGNYAVAEDYFNRALKLSPNYALIHINLGILKNAIGFSDAAEPYFAKALELDPGNPECYYFYANWLSQKFQYEHALKLTLDGLKISPGHNQLLVLKEQLSKTFKQNGGQIELGHEQLLNMSLQLYQQGNFEGCIMMAEKALQVKPDYAEAYNNICAAFNQLGKFEESVAAADKGLEIKPDYELLKNNRAASLNKQKIK